MDKFEKDWLKFHLMLVIILVVSLVAIFTFKAEADYDGELNPNEFINWEVARYGPCPTNANHRHIIISNPDKDSSIKEVFIMFNLYDPIGEIEKSPTISTFIFRIKGQDYVGTFDRYMYHIDGFAYVFRFNPIRGRYIRIDNQGNEILDI